MKKLIVLIAISLFTLGNSGFAQEIDYLRKANEAFIKGNYTYAVNMYNMYYAETGKDVSELKRQAELCRDYLKNADDAALTKDYATASTYYQKILELNPEDTSVKSKLSNLESDVSSSGLKLGQEYMGGRIAYIDNTGKHGFVITSISKEPMTHHKGLKKTPKGSRVPTLRELIMIAPCAEILKLCDTKFWSIDISFKGGWGFSSEYSYIYFKKYSDSNYGSNYLTGKAIKDEHFSFIYIKDF